MGAAPHHNRQDAAIHEPLKACPLTDTEAQDRRWAPASPRLPQGCPRKPSETGDDAYAGASFTAHLDTLCPKPQQRTVAYSSRSRRSPEHSRQQRRCVRSEMKDKTPPRSTTAPGSGLSTPPFLCMTDILSAARVTAQQLEQRAFPLLSTPPQARSGRWTAPDACGGDDMPSKVAAGTSPVSRTDASGVGVGVGVGVGGSGGCDSSYTASDASFPFPCGVGERSGSGGGGAQNGSLVREYPSLEPTPRLRCGAVAEELSLLPEEGTAPPPSFARKERDFCYLVPARAFHRLHVCLTALQQDMREYRGRIDMEAEGMRVRVAAANRVFAVEAEDHLGAMKTAMEELQSSARGAV